MSGVRQVMNAGVEVTALALLFGAAAAVGAASAVVVSTFGLALFSPCAQLGLGLAALLFGAAFGIAGAISRAEDDGTWARVALIGGTGLVVGAVLSFVAAQPLLLNGPDGDGGPLNAVEALCVLAVGICVARISRRGLSRFFGQVETSEAPAHG